MGALQDKLAPVVPESAMALAMKTMKAMKAAMKKGGMKKAAMKKGMKAMKAMKAMKKKAMKKKAMKVSKIAKGKRARSSVFRGTKEKTQSGLAKSDMMKSKSGKIVMHAKRHARSSESKASALSEAKPRKERRCMPRLSRSSPDIRDTSQSVACGHNS